MLRDTNACSQRPGVGHSKLQQVVAGVAVSRELPQIVAAVSAVAEGGDK